MAVGDVGYFQYLIQSLLPEGWVSEDDEVVPALTYPASDAMAWVYNLIKFTQLQTRVATATEEFLDLAGYDFLGTSISRNVGELDSAYSVRVRSQILAIKVSKIGIESAIKSVYSGKFTVYEPFKVADMGGGYDVPASKWGYDVAGIWGTAMGYEPFTFYVTLNSSIPCTYTGIAAVNATVNAAIVAARGTSTTVWVTTSS